MSSTTVLSSTVANTNPSSSGLNARSNAPPGAGLTENCSTNCPSAVNSTTSLGWFGSGFTASPCVEIKSPLRVEGEVRVPGIYKIQQRDSLREILERAGGLS